MTSPPSIRSLFCAQEKQKHTQGSLFVVVVVVVVVCLFVYDVKRILVDLCARPAKIDLKKNRENKKPKGQINLIFMIRRK